MAVFEYKRYITRSNFKNCSSSHSINPYKSKTRVKESCVVNSKLSNMVADSLNTLHSKLDDIPPQNLAYAVSIVMDKFLTVSGRPSNITASANVTLGASDMSPNEVAKILKGASKTVKEQPTEASEQKVVDVKPND